VDVATDRQVFAEAARALKAIAYECPETWSVEAILQDVLDRAGVAAEVRRGEDRGAIVYVAQITGDASVYIGVGGALQAALAAAWKVWDGAERAWHPRKA
jgi:hypothetical protein